VTGWPVRADIAIASKTSTPCSTSSADIGYGRFSLTATANAFNSACNVSKSGVTTTSGLNSARCPALGRSAGQTGTPRAHHRGPFVGTPRTVLIGSFGSCFASQLLQLSEKYATPSFHRLPR
jgi:hypothetical protein